MALYSFFTLRLLLFSNKPQDIWKAIKKTLLKIILKALLEHYGRILKAGLNFSWKRNRKCGNGTFKWTALTFWKGYKRCYIRQIINAILPLIEDKLLFIFLLKTFSFKWKTGLAVPAKVFPVFLLYWQAAQIHRLCRTIAC